MIRRQLLQPIYCCQALWLLNWWWQLLYQLSWPRCHHLYVIEYNRSRIQWSTLNSTKICKMIAHVYKWDSFVFYHELNLRHTKKTKLKLDQFFQSKCICIFDLPINGPNAVTKTALPIICHPNAAGSCSNEQCSDTVKVKLLNAIPIERTFTFHSSFQIMKM